MWNNIPWSRRTEIAEQIRCMPESIRKQILHLAFVEGMSTTDIANFAEKNDTMHSRLGKPIGRRRIQQIIAEEIPDHSAYQIKGTAKKQGRGDHAKYIYHAQKRKCANCGAESNLEMHHMIPVFLGGTAEPENMICMCKSCHAAITAYQSRMFPEYFQHK